MSYSKAPWIAIRGDEGSQDTEWGVKSGDYWVASFYYSGADDVRNGTAEENARLCAAAPDLLFQLLAAANYIDALGGDSKSYRAAIKAAKGEA